jgi:hypothetical protein
MRRLGRLNFFFFLLLVLVCGGGGAWRGGVGVFSHQQRMPDGARSVMALGNFFFPFSFFRNSCRERGPTGAAQMTLNMCHLCLLDVIAQHTILFLQTCMGGSVLKKVTAWVSKIKIPESKDFEMHFNICLLNHIGLFCLKNKGTLMFLQLIYQQRLQKKMLHLLCVLYPIRWTPNCSAIVLLHTSMMVAWPEMYNLASLTVYMFSSRLSTSFKIVLQGHLF